MSEPLKVKLSEDHFFEIMVDDEGILLDGNSIDTDIVKTGKDEWSVIHQHHSYIVRLLSFDAQAKQVSLSVDDEVYNIVLEDQLDQLLHDMGMDRGGSSKLDNVLAPMPGLVLDILVKEGQSVEKGDALIILEAMKMENIIKANGNGIVKCVCIKNQDAVEKNQVLIEME